ncbi:MAG: thylakoid membrane photosystem I accumulation factor [Gomphosphaeria aponina SAG 52.96 = DSM 107014]|uniref:Thylakoid membrane photosystem I accumulation factor n=1 Tax=Gomphosphaeria aponina SAG 52.96 = DSM 107014 TaxID=1521640 RepID=A0A941GW22_9CHRO|nr:thylakoid membrane photosystem I accumulation factor [Gomphosphaeria aponina SAG 52.96 = DSM 107014]
MVTSFQWLRWLTLCCLTLIFTSCWLFNSLPTLAALDDDRFDGNIFVVYAGNGSLVPPRFTLSESLKRETPTLLVYYLDDSKDCKEFAIVVSTFQEYYGRAASIIPVSVDTIPIKSSYTPEEPGYYYEGFVPQTVLLDEKGEVVFNGKGQVKFEAVDDVLREVFDLLPRSESVELKRRSFNEFNTELVQ